MTVNLVLILLPLTGITTLRLYESALIRQTESELIAQAAHIVAAYKAAWLAEADADALAGMPAVADPTLAIKPEDAGDWRPRFAELDLADDPVLPVPPDATLPAVPPEPIAAAVGERLQSALRDAQLTTLAGMRVLDRNGVVVATTREELGLSLAGREEVARALEGRAHSLMRERVSDSPKPPLASISRTGDVRVFVALPAIEGDRVLGAAVLSRTARSIDQALYSKRYHLLGLASALLAAVIGFATFAALTINRPLQAVIRQARQAAAGHSGAMTPLTRPVTREIAELSQSLVAMSRALEARADYVRAFAADASHEFKTPLAALRGAMELLRDHGDEMTADERARFLGNAEADIARLDRLVRRLLELARADMLATAADARADLAAVVGRCVERAAALGLAVEIVPPADRAVVAAIDPDTLESAIGNLFDNMRQHAGPGATGRVSWRVEGAEAAILVSDDGVGVSSGNAARIFDRFFTTARDRGGAGLGLPIVRSQLAAHGGSIALTPSARGAAFEIRVPLRRRSDERAGR